MSIDLTQERVRTLFDYDSKNGILLRKFKSGKLKPGGHKPTHSRGYSRILVDRKLYFTHRVIWLWHHGSWPEGEIDHIDRNLMNNRIDNLRDVSRSENKHNRGLQRNNSSGYLGVSWNKQREKYQAHIKVNSKKIFLGRFDTTEEAYLAYQLAKIKLHPTSPLAQEYYRELTLAG